VGTLRDLVGRTPVFGICLGHQLLGLALGAETYKLPFGHHGANHPVRNLRTGRIEITSQNHGFAVREGSLPSGVELTHKNLYDGTVEGLKSESLRAHSVQYHPESSPGPRDSGYLFDEFVADLSRTGD
jgi:carbamoyl-phosphate synthase small subunit